MSNMQNIDGIVAQPVEDPERVANDRNHADLRALRDARSGFWDTANAVNNIAQPALNGLSYCRAGTG